jgi:hypothetical protein
MKKKTMIVIALIAMFSLIFYTQITLFVIQPIGALPEGRTVVILRLDKTKFIDSPDSMCERNQGGVSLMCRAMMMAAVINNASILMRLPYSETLYNISTNGKSYDR